MAKRNSWPKTRGVAMNPVDHVRHSPLIIIANTTSNAYLPSLTVVVTTSISVRHRPSAATPQRVKKPVSSPPAELVSSAVRKRSRTRGFEKMVFFFRGSYRALFTYSSAGESSGCFLFGKIMFQDVSMVSVIHTTHTHTNPKQVL